MDEKMPGKRLQHFGVIAVLTVLLSILFAYVKGLRVDSLLIVLMTDIIFLAVVLYMLESCRMAGSFGSGQSCNYGRIADWYGIFCAVAAGCCFLPSFACPAAAMALFLSMVSTVEAAITLSGFLCVLLGIAQGGDFYALAAYCVLIVIGAQLAKTMRDKKLRFWGCLVLFGVSVCIPLLFHYLAYERSSLRIFGLNVLFGAATVFAYTVFAERIYDKSDQEDESTYEKIIDENYPFVVDMKNYSMAEYIRAVKAATISRRCASLIGANELAAAAGGFYYRVGILEGEPFVENGVRLAKEGCFPAAVTEILSEYGSEEKLPSTRESAIVHMVDAYIRKAEQLKSQETSDSWNPEMVIYQMLNELSASGIYDNSGLSMNQFLKVRELLVHEEIVHDNTNGRRDRGAV